MAAPMYTPVDDDLRVNADERELIMMIGEGQRHKLLHNFAWQHRRATTVVGAVGLGLAVLVLAACTHVNRSSRSVGTSSLRSGTVQKSESEGALPILLKVLGEAAEGIHDAAKITDEIDSSYHDARKMYGNVKHSMHEMKELAGDLVDDLGKPIRLSMALKKTLHNLNTTQKAMLREKLLKRLNITSLHDLAPDPSSISDDGECASDEELHEGLCYKRCLLLTEAKEPFRESAFQCCEHEPPCGMMGGSVEAKPCGGYAVSGDSTGNVCPHTPGGCLKDEELFEGVCYMRCNLLTYNMLNFRDTADSCCKSGSPFAMLEFGACDTDTAYAVGGGKGDGDASTPDVPHTPLRPRVSEHEVQFLQ